MKEDKRKESLVFLDSLTDALGRSEDQSLEEVKNDLRDEGIDVEASMERLMSSVKDISMEARRKQLDLAKEKRDEIESKYPDFIGKFSKLTREEILSRIQEIGSSFGLEASVAYRDLESKDIDDLRSLLEDLELAKHIDENSSDEE